MSPIIGLQFMNIDKLNNINKKNKIVFLDASRIEPRKGMHVLIEALGEIKRKKTITPLEIIACGTIHSSSYGYYIFERAKDLEIFDTIKFTKILEREDLYKLLKRVDCLIMPSTDLETLGMLTLESLCFGIPVLAFNRGASPEILNPVDKRLIINDVSSSGLADRILWFTKQNMKERNELRRKSRMVFCSICDKQKLIESLNGII